METPGPDANQDEQGSGSGSDTSLQSFITKLEKQQTKSFSKSPLLTSKPFPKDHERNTKNIKAAENIPDSLPQKDSQRGRLPSLTIPPESKLQRKDSSSPETDPDFQGSSSLEQEEEEEEVRSDCTDTSWILKQDMLEGGSVVDSRGEEWMFSKAGAKARNKNRTRRRVRRPSFIGRGSQRLTKDRVRKPVDKNGDGHGIKGNGQEGEEEEEEEDEEEDDKDWNINTNQISAEQAKIAAAASVLMLGMLWYCYPELRGPKFA